MADEIQCDNCGAVISVEDLFCGECGVPRPVTEAAEPWKTYEPAVEEAVPTSDPSPSLSPASVDTRWRVSFTVLLVLGGLACLASLVAFLLVGSIGGDTTTPTEDWLISAFCCLLPLGGAGAVLAAASAAIWYSRVRSR
jgi:hypothetical protein